jgi:TolA-binding protein
MRQISLAIAAFAVLLPLGVAHSQPMVQSQEGIALENQILQLQQQIQQMQSGGGGGGSSLGGSSAPAPMAPSSGAPPDSSVVTNLLTQVNQLQNQVQELSGKVDTLQNQVSTQNATMQKEIDDLKFQMTNGSAPPVPGAPAAPGGPQAMNAPASDTPTAPPPPPAAAPVSPKLALRDAEAALAKHNYAQAEQNARSILATAKTSPEGYQAQYILAQSLYGEGKNQDAAIAFDDAYNRAHSGSNAPGALLGLANSLTAIHQASAACDTLASLNSQFPDPPKGMAPAIVAASRRAHCN